MFRVLRPLLPSIESPQGFRTILTISGLIYRQYKPVYWSPSSGTALAEAELEYDENHTSTAAFVKFPLQISEAFRREFQSIDWKTLNAVIWTTTPWTLPANKAIAVHKDMDYSVVVNPDMPNGQLLVATSRIEYLESILGHEFDIVTSGILGAKLAGNLHYHNPLHGRHAKPQPIIHADFVSDISGSGLVHLAPGHGTDDYNVCSELSIPAFAPIDDQGRYTDVALPEQPDLFQGLSVQGEGTNAVLSYLKGMDIDYVVGTHVIKHKYPIDWRTKQPVIVRATEQWFANVDGIKSGSMQALEDVNFIPEGGKVRLQSFIEGRSQWCISRQRAWGVPIPALYRTDTGKHEAVMNGPTIGHIMEVIEKRGIDAWWTDPEDDMAWIPEHLEGAYVRGKDTMDVWFDSGTSWTLLPERSNGPVADVYLEGTDQHRGWFQSSLLTYVAHQAISEEVAQGIAHESQTSDHKIKPPFKTLITHGFTLDQDGRKMSKSLGNVISPDEIMSGSLLPPLKHKKQKGKGKAKNDIDDPKPTYDAMGPDALRLWVASSDYTKDVVIGQPILQAVNTALHKYRVTFKWLLGVLGLQTRGFDSFDLRTLHTQLLDSDISLIDKIALHRLSQVSREVHSHYTAYEFFRGINALNKYIAHDLSAFYFETLKDRIYAGSTTDRLSAERVLGIIFWELCQMLAPVCPLLVEEVWEWTPKPMKDVSEHPARVVWTPFDLPVADVEMQKLNRQIEALSSVHTAIKAAQERARAEKKLGSGLESSVLISLPKQADKHVVDLLNDNREEELAGIFVVSGVSVVEAEGVDTMLKELKPAWKFEESFDIHADEESKHAKKGTGWVLVVPPTQHKCPRCWRFIAPEPEALCQRCDEAVKEDKE